jgi:hypothetical protein
MNPELESAFKTFLEKLIHPPTKTWMDHLNSPVVVTLVGGALLAVISTTLTQCNAINARDREIALEKLHRKQNFIETFASKIEQYLTLTVGLRKREIFLAEWAKVPEHATARFSDGRTFDETRAKWEEDKRYWIEHSSGTTPLAVIYTAKILFPKPDIVDKLDHLEQSTDLYGRTTKFEDLVTAYNQVLDDLGEVTSILAKESYEK